MTESNNTSNTPSTLASPLLESDLPASLRKTYKGLVHKFFHAIECGTIRPPDAAYETVCEIIVRTVTDHPVLATVVSNDHNRSLLRDLCRGFFPSPLMLPAIKLLIQQNPSALLWKSGQSQDGTSLISDIAIRSTYCVLLIWIAKHYSWVLDHPDTREYPPHFKLLDIYLNDMSCTADTVRTFFEHYPQGLSQQDGVAKELALHKCISGDERTCDPELFRWMAEQYPPSMLHTSNYGSTPLHYACFNVPSDDENSSRDNDMREICHFLITTCPDAARMKDRHDLLPIHWCARCVHRRVGQDVAMMLLRAYPESIDVVGHIPFLQEISPLLAEEKSLQSDIVFLAHGLQCLEEAANGSRSSFLNFTSVYEEWVALRKVETQSRLDSIPSELDTACRLHEGNRWTGSLRR